MKLGEPYIFHFHVDVKLCVHIVGLLYVVIDIS